LRITAKKAACYRSKRSPIITQSEPAALADYCSLFGLKLTAGFINLALMPHGWIHLQRFARQAN